MPVATVCNTHGRSECEEVCEHLAAAVVAGTRLPAMTCYMVIEWPVEKWLCHACVVGRGLPNPSRPISTTESASAAFACEAVCERCFAAAVRRAS